MRFTRQTRSFTLIELLIVISIIVALMGILVFSLSGATDKARELQALSEIKSLEKGIQAYFDVRGEYPSDGLDEGTPDESSGWLYEALDGDGWPLEEGRQATEALARAKRAYFKAPPNMLEEGDWSSKESRPKLRDPWNHFYQYVRNRQKNGRPVETVSSRTGPPGDYTDPREDSSGAVVPQNAKSYDLWSWGKDQNHPITSWSR